MRYKDDKNFMLAATEITNYWGPVKLKFWDSCCNNENTIMPQ